MLSHSIGPPVRTAAWTHVEISTAVWHNICIFTRLFSVIHYQRLNDHFVKSVWQFKLPMTILRTMFKLKNLWTRADVWIDDDWKTSHNTPKFTYIGISPGEMVPISTPCRHIYLATNKPADTKLYSGNTSPYKYRTKAVVDRAFCCISACYSATLDGWWHNWWPSVTTERIKVPSITHRFLVAEARTPGVIKMKLVSW